MNKLSSLKSKEFKQVMDNLKSSAVLEYSDLARDSTLLRFELTSELSFKVLKMHLGSKL